MAVTAEEREALEGIAAARNLKSFTPLMRTMPLNEVVEQWRRLRDVLERSANFRPARDDAGNVPLAA